MGPIASSVLFVPPTTQLTPHLHQPYLNWNLNIFAGIQLLMSAEIHWPVEERNNIGIEGKPVRVLEMVLLALRKKSNVSRVPLNLNLKDDRALTASFSNRSTIVKALGS